jgi:hypothetical protein
MAEQTTGIAGSQSRVRDSATQARNNKKGSLKKSFVPLLVIAGVAIPILLWWRSEGTETIAEITKSSPTAQAPVASQQQRTVTLGSRVTQPVPHNIEKTYAVTPKWDVLEDNGTAPLNVSSEEVVLPKRCYIDFGDTPGYGSLYVVHFSYPGQPWRRLEMGEHTEFMDRVKVVPLQAALEPKQFTLKVECRRRAY